MRATIRIHLIIVIFIFCSLNITAFAHPGRTDSYGGHRESATGDYHYHHGYPEHDHYDMDGDGTEDCPYNFKDNTSDVTHYTNPAKYDVTVKELPPVKQSSETISEETDEDKETIPDWILMGLSGALVISFWLIPFIASGETILGKIALGFLTAGIGFIIGALFWFVDNVVFTFIYENVDVIAIIEVLSIAFTLACILALPTYLFVTWLIDKLRNK